MLQNFVVETFDRGFGNPMCQLCTSFFLATSVEEMTNDMLFDYTVASDDMKAFMSNNPFSCTATSELILDSLKEQKEEEQECIKISVNDDDDATNVPVTSSDLLLETTFYSPCKGLIVLETDESALKMAVMFFVNDEDEDYRIIDPSTKTHYKFPRLNGVGGLEEFLYHISKRGELNLTLFRLEAKKDEKDVLQGSASTTKPMEEEEEEEVAPLPKKGKQQRTATKRTASKRSKTTDITTTSSSTKRKRKKVASSDNEYCGEKDAEKKEET